MAPRNSNDGAEDAIAESLQYDGRRQRMFPLIVPHEHDGVLFALLYEYDGVLEPTAQVLAANLSSLKA